nr:putative ribonuclease H-like domain-containing protein [Tanacetum cinerariifolium]
MIAFCYFKYFIGCVLPIVFYLLRGVAKVPTDSGSIPTAGPLATGVPTGSDVVPTTCLIFATATVIMIDGLDRSNETIAKYLQEYHQFATELPIERRIESISDLVRYQDNYAKVHKYQTQKRKPLTKKHQRKFYTLVLRNQAGWKAKDFKRMILEEIKEIFDPVWKKIHDFIPIGSKEEAERFKRKGIRFEQESVKKLKTSEEVKATEEVPEEKLKEMIQLIPIEEVYVEALQVKHPIIDWKMRIVGNKMHKAFPLPIMKFLLLGEVPTTSEESSHCQKKRDATAHKIALLLKKFPTGSTKFSNADMRKKGNAVKASASCSRNMTGNISYLSDYELFDGGYVSFGQGGCKITGKGTIKTGKLKFENVYFVKDLKYNLFSVSQLYDNKNSVLFTNLVCIVLGRDFKLLDDANVLLRTPMHHNMYSIDLNNIVPHKDLICLVAKASADECMLWHMRLAYLTAGLAVLTLAVLVSVDLSVAFTNLMKGLGEMLVNAYYSQLQYHQQTLGVLSKTNPSWEENRLEQEGEEQHCILTPSCSCPIFDSLKGCLATAQSSSAVASLCISSGNLSSLAVGSCSGSGMQVGMPCAFYSQHKVS